MPGQKQTDILIANKGKMKYHVMSCERISDVSADRGTPSGRRCEKDVVLWSIAESDISIAAHHKTTKVSSRKYRPLLSAIGKLST